MNLPQNPYFYGVATLAVLFLFYTLITMYWNPLDIVRGADGRPSTSKTQFFLWTTMTIFGYATVFASSALHGHFDPIDQFPQNLLIAMGLSVTTAVAAKAVTVSYLQSGKISKTHTSADKAVAGLSAILMNDDGDIDLAKIQMMAWTFIALSVYFVRVVHFVNSPSSVVEPKLPDIDGALMVLMGLGQAHI